MAPKPAKGSAKKSDATSGNKNWEAALTKEVFEEDSWRACVSLVVETSPEDETLIQALALAVQKPLRKLFTVLTWDDTQAKIHEFGNPKNKKRDNVPMFSEVTEPAKVLLDAGENIPCDLLAKLVKFQLLQIKSNDLQRRRTEQVKPVDERVNAVPWSAGKEKGGGKDKKAKNPPSPTLEKKTKLKRRDDVEPPDYIDDEPDDGPQHYILLLGFYQPHLIGALDSIGIQVANVIKLLHHTKGQQGEHSTESNKQSENTAANKDDKDAELEDDCAKRLAAQELKLDHFWAGLRPYLDSGPLNSKLHDVAELSYTVGIPSVNKQDPEAMLTFGSSIFEGIACLIYDSLDWRRQHQHYLDNIKIINVPNLSVDAQPAERVVSAPLPRSKKKPVQEESLPTQETKVSSTDVDMCYYNKLLDMVPPEACSVPLVLHCMLEQVVFSSDHPVPVLPDVAEEPSSYTGPSLDQQLVSCMLQSFLPLVHTEKDKSHLLNSLLTIVHNKEDKKKLLEKFGRQEKKSGEPLVLRHHDHRALRLRNTHAGEGFNSAEVEMNMLKMTPVCDLIQSVAQQRNSSCWMAIKQQLQYYCTNDVVSWPEVERLFHQSVFESMPLTKLDCKGVLQKAAEPLESLESAQQLTPSAVPWDDPVSFAKQQLWNLQHQGPTFLTEDPGHTEVNKEACIHLELSDIQNYRLRSLFDWNYTEHHSATTFPQVLQLASEEYTCLDTFRGSSNNILYLYCHNPMNHRRQCSESWDVALHTTIKFRKYLENVADKISDWTNEEESKREAMKRQQNVSPVNPPHVEDGASPAENKPELEPVIRKESLKAWKIEQERLKEEELAKKAKKDNTQKGKQGKEDTAAIDNKKGQNKTPQSAKKGRADTACSSTKTPTGSINTKTNDNKERDQTEEHFNGFRGYDMDGKLIHVSGNLQYLYPSDGGCIIVERDSYVEGSSLMKVAVKKDGHHFYTHVNHIFEEPSGPSLQTLKEGHKEENKVSAGITKVKHGSLTAVFDSGIRLSYSFYGPTGRYIENPQETLNQSPEASTLNLGTQRSEETQTDLLNHKPTCPSNPSRLSEPQVCKGQLVLPSSSFNSLNICVPNGLLLQFLCEDTQEELGMLVRQSFPFLGKEDVGQIPDPSLCKELSRLVTSQGAVVRSMRDGSTEVLFADGSVSFSQDSGPVWVAASGNKNTTEVAGVDTKEQITENDGAKERGFWTTTTPSGARICTVGTTHKCMPTPPLLVFKATDPITHEVMLTREDGVISVQNPNGSITVEHADGTRITSLYQDTRSLLRGERPQSETLKSSSAECVCGCTECVCVPHCAQSLIENSGEEINNNNTSRIQSPYLVVGHVERERAETTVFKSGKERAVGSRKSSTSENENVSTKERVVLVEKEGCATVVMYPEQQIAHVFLADGTVITGNNKGAYQVFPSSAGLLQIQSDGKCVYNSDSLETPCPKDGSPINQAGSYTMSHTDNVACDITDPDGNHFQVMEDGTITVLNFSPAPSTLGEKEHEDEEDREIARSIVKQTEHIPRLFIVHQNGSGTELLHSQTVEELLFQAYSDPTIAIIKEPLPESQDEFGITILKPCPESIWSQWLLAKQKPDITPPNLRNRSWHDFPREEKPTPGPAFGTDLGRCLTLTPRSGSVTQRPPVRSCPKVLEMRELFQHRPFTAPLKTTLDKQLKEYIESLMEREQRSEQMKIKDPRSERESVHASDLLNLVLSFAEEDDSSHNTEKRTSDISSLYIQGVGAGPVESDSSDDTTTAASESFAIRKDSKWAGRLAQYRQELCEEKACREALKTKTVVPYFDLENISLYESLLHQQITNTKSPVSPVSHNTEAPDTQEKAKLFHSPRPLNPKASQPESHTARRMAAKGPEEKSPCISPNQTAAERGLKASAQNKAVHVDVTGKPRKTKVRLPTCINTTKPSSVPNHQFLSVEEPVRRKCRTISLTNPNFTMRGFHLHPPRVDFGAVQEGTTSAVTVAMKNVGVDTCRFNVKQPLSSTGLRVVYNPGPVAAGLHVELQVQLFAMCAVQAGEAETKKSLSQDIIIHTETEILYLPVTATILSEKLYDAWVKDHERGQGKKGSRTSKLSYSGTNPLPKQPSNFTS